MKVILKQIADQKKVFNNGLLVMILIGCTVLNISAFANNSDSVPYKLHTRTIKIVNANFIILTENLHFQEIVH